MPRWQNVTQVTLSSRCKFVAIRPLFYRLIRFWIDYVDRQCEGDAPTLGIKRECVLQRWSWTSLILAQGAAIGLCGVSYFIPVRSGGANGPPSGDPE